MKRFFSVAAVTCLLTAPAAFAGDGEANRTDPRDVASERAFGMQGNPGRGVRTRTGHEVRNAGHGENGDLTGHGHGLGHQGEPDDEG